MKHGRSPRLIVAVVMATAVIAALTGCMSVPTSGKVEQADKGESVGTKKNEVVPKPPPQDATPREVVNGFLLAMSRYQPNYKTARQFLSSDVRDNWRPEDKAVIYTNPRFNVSKNNVKMRMNTTGELGEEAGYEARRGESSKDFKLRRTEDGQWRISNPPDGLLISEVSFSSSYSSYNVYFFDPRFHTVVPEPVYLPSGAQTATALVKRLLAGPSTWLRPAVTSAVPAKTTLVTNSVPVEDGLAQISLSETINDLESEQRKNLAIQLVWTLKDVESSDIKGIEITVDGDTYHIPGEEKQNGKTFVSADIGHQWDPIVKHRELIAGIHQNRVVTLDPSSSRPDLDPIPAPLGRPTFQVDSVALAADGKTIAAVTGGRSQLRVQGRKKHTATKVLDGKQRLLAPEFARNDELWAISGKPGEQRVSAITGDQVTKVRSPWLKRAHVTAFRISPDGSRIALVVRRHGKDRLAMAPIVRGEHWRLGELRPIQVLDNTSAPIDRIAGLGWISPTRLMIIGASGKGGSDEPYGVEMDGSQVERIGVSNHWDAISLSAAPDTSGSFHAAVGGRAGKVWVRRSGDKWKFLTNGLTKPVYAG